MICWMHFTMWHAEQNNCEVEKCDLKKGFGSVKNPAPCEWLAQSLRKGYLGWGASLHSPENELGLVGNQSRCWEIASWNHSLLPAPELTASQCLCRSLVRKSSVLFITHNKLLSLQISNTFQNKLDLEIWTGESWRDKQGRSDDTTRGNTSMYFCRYVLFASG